jgi:hypothetical protein
MKKNTLLAGAAFSVAAAAAIFGLMDRSQAANLTNTDTASVVQERGMRARLTQEEVDALRAERESARTAVDAAMQANDYEAWVAAVGPNNPWLDKITKDNFSKLVEAHNLRQQADQIMTDLGIARGPQEGLGLGGMMGKGGDHAGVGRGAAGRGLNCGLGTVEANK